MTSSRAPVRFPLQLRRLGTSPHSPSGLCIPATVLRIVGIEPTTEGSLTRECGLWGFEVGFGIFPFWG